MDELVSEGLRLGAHFARPAGVTRVPALLVLPGFPRGAGGAAALGNTDQTLCDRIARESGWAGMTFTFRGTGPSEGDFSIEGWLADVRAAVDALHERTDVTGVWIAGFRLGGTLAIVVAADDDRVRGIATFAAPASLRTWVREPDWFLEYARRTGVLRNPEFPPDSDRWIRAIANLDPVARRRVSRPGRGCSSTAAPTTSFPSRTRAASRTRRGTGSTCASWRTVPTG
jgi:pimeloyl-ACP methyl ester carboxylesterase